MQKSFDLLLQVYQDLDKTDQSLIALQQTADNFYKSLKEFQDKMEELPMDYSVTSKEGGPSRGGNLSEDLNLTPTTSTIGARIRAKRNQRLSLSSPSTEGNSLSELETASPNFPILKRKNKMQCSKTLKCRKTIASAFSAGVVNNGISVSVMVQNIQHQTQKITEIVQVPSLQNENCLMPAKVEDNLSNTKEKKQTNRCRQIKAKTKATKNNGALQKPRQPYTRRKPTKKNSKVKEEVFGIKKEVDVQAEEENLENIDCDRPMILLEPLKSRSERFLTCDDPLYPFHVGSLDLEDVDNPESKDLIGPSQKSSESIPSESKKLEGTNLELNKSLEESSPKLSNDSRIQQVEENEAISKEERLANVEALLDEMYGGNEEQSGSNVNCENCQENNIKSNRIDESDLPLDLFNEIRIAGHSPKDNIFKKTANEDLTDTLEEDSEPSLQTLSRDKDFDNGSSVKIEVEPDIENLVGQNESNSPNQLQIVEDVHPERPSNDSNGAGELDTPAPANDHDQSLDDLEGVKQMIGNIDAFDEFASIHSTPKRPKVEITSVISFSSERPLHEVIPGFEYPMSPTPEEVKDEAGFISYLPYKVFEIWLPEIRRVRRGVADPRLRRDNDQFPRRSSVAPDTSLEAYNRHSMNPSTRLMGSATDISISLPLNLVRNGKAAANESMFTLLHNSTWYQCLSPSIKIHVNQAMKDFISSLIAFFAARASCPSLLYDIYSLDSAGEILETLHSLGCDIDKNGEFHYYKATPNIITTCTVIDEATTAATGPSAFANLGHNHPAASSSFDGVTQPHSNGFVGPPAPQTYLSHRLAMQKQNANGTEGSQGYGSNFRRSYGENNGGDQNQNQGYGQRYKDRDSFPNSAGSAGGFDNFRSNRFNCRSGNHYNNYNKDNNNQNPFNKNNNNNRRNNYDENRFNSRRRSVVDYNDDRFSPNSNGNESSARDNHNDSFQKIYEKTLSPSLPSSSSNDTPNNSEEFENKSLPSAEPSYPSKPQQSSVQEDEEEECWD